MTAPFQELRPPAPAAGLADAEQLANHFNQIMETLLDVVEEETELVRAGRLTDAAKLERSKTELAQLYLADAAQVKSFGPVLRQSMPDLLASLRQRHDTFRALLQINLTVLATAHAVAEGLVRGVSGELARRAMPQTYGASGRTTAAPLHVTPPLALSRCL
jgi:hypothetical protein